MPSLPPDGYLAHLDRATGAFAAVLESGDLDAPVPGCRPWRLTDLAHHLGGIHRWARTAVVDGRVGPDTVEGAPTERAALVGWFREGAEELAAGLRAAGPGAPCWTFGPHPQAASFWFRRQAHETALHVHDAQVSQGAPVPLAPELLLDGVDEVVGMFFPRQVRLGRIPPVPAALALEPAEGGRWVLAGDGTGAPEEAGEAAATVRGPAEAVLLLLWHRTGADDPRLTVAGDRGAADAVLGAALTP